MNPTEVYAVHAELIGALNGMFEIWLGFTFATIVAVHVAAQTINKWVLGVGISLYLLASYVFLIRYAHTGSVIVFLNERLAEASLPAYPTPGAMLGLMTLLVFL